MAPRGWAALSSRKSWLDLKMEGYILARASNTLDSWLAKVFHEYFSAYHWSLQDNEEPDSSQVYNEPAPSDSEAVSVKEAKISARKDVRWKFHYFIATLMFLAHSKFGTISKITFALNPRKQRVKKVTLF